MRFFALLLSSLFTLGLFATGSVSAANTSKEIDTLTPHQASYKASYNGMPISSERKFFKDGNSYILSNKAKNFLGSLTEEERFTVDEQGNISPLYYRFERAIFGNKRSETTDFQRDSSIAVNKYKGKTVELPLSDSPLAPLSYQEQMRYDLMAGKTSFNYQVVYRNKIRDYQYRVIDEETIDTPLGKLETTVLERIRDNDERETRLWMAKKLAYLPVKLVQKEDGETYEMMIESYSN